MAEKLKAIFQLKDLRDKFLVTIGLLAVTRILAHIPLPGVDISALKNIFSSNQTFGLLDLFSGGTISNFSIVLMGVGPYITSSIVFQLLGVIVPYFENLQKNEGEAGRQKLNLYTRIATVPFAIIQSYGLISVLKNQNLIGNLSYSDIATMTLISTAGTILMMWLGEIISEKGIGNGVSLIITLGIIAGFPTQIRNTIASVQTSQIISLIVYLILFVIVIALIVATSEAQRELPITYARRVRETGYGSVSTHLPIRITAAGVIPIIFALAILTFPTVLAKFLLGAKSQTIAHFAQATQSFLENQTYYCIFYFIFVVAFTFFYTYIIFQPKQISENLQKQGAFIPGIRPGKETEKYINYILARVTLFGAIFLGMIAVMPFVIQNLLGLKTIALGGTSILIIVSVTIETYRQIESQLLIRTYDNY